MFATAFGISDNGFTLKVDPNLGKATQMWLHNQKCIFQTLPFETYTLFEIASAPNGVIQRLSSKFLSPANDNDEIQQKVDSLRDCIEKSSWKSILEETSQWSNDLKKRVWLKLSASEKKTIHQIAKMQKFSDTLSALKLSDIKKVISIFKEVEILSKSVKVTKDSKQEDLVNMLKELITTHEKFLKAALTLVLGDCE
ncbi:MAG: hypothetical protein KME49_22500 [Brasilonema octagenarum HA4186-MV1]|jgi:histidyl-tRNA synthetase|nr:hypothetical protein [Brasilonema octagenarum HA4186-MV1]